MAEVDAVPTRYRKLRHVMNDCVARLWAATEAEALGYAGIATAMKKATMVGDSSMRYGKRRAAAVWSRLSKRGRLNGARRQFTCPRIHCRCRGRAHALPFAS